MRSRLTRREWADLAFKQGGRCIVDGCESEGPFHAEHTIPSAFVGGKPDALMCVTCHRQKTKKDVREIARAKRLSGEVDSQYERRRKFGPALKSNNTFRSYRNG